MTYDRPLIGLAALCLTLTVAAPLGRAAEPAPAMPRKPVAALVADWFPGSHPDVIIRRILETYSLDGKGEPSALQLVTVYRDLPTARDQCGQFATNFGVRVCSNITEALTLGTGKLAVDGVLLSTEWAPYPVSDTGQVMYPHRAMFAEIVRVFEASGRVVPVFIDKHLADTWADSKWIYDEAQRRKIPLMAGSSVPVSWRHPATDIPRGARVKEIVGVSYHTLDCYGFHGLEMVQTLAERRRGGETGVKSVRCLVSNAVWEAAGKLYDPALLDAAVARLDRKLPAGKTLQEAVTQPTLFVIDYHDGLRVNLFTLNFFAAQWSAAWRFADDGRVDSTLFWLEEQKPFGHFATQMKGIEQMILTGQPSWPVERTLLTSGVLDAALISKKNGGQPVPTPHLAVRYTPAWEWQQPPAP